LRFSMGEFHGIQEYYHPEGTVKTYLCYTNGQFEEGQEFTVDGTLHRQVEFLDGVLKDQIE
jgi:hypothetical protein